MNNLGYINKEYIIIMCVHTYILNCRIQYVLSSWCDCIDKREKTMINNDYMIKNIYNSNVCSYLHTE